MRSSVTCLLVFFLNAVFVERAFSEERVESFSGEWSFESYRHELFSADSENVNDDTDLAILWLPKSKLRLKVDSATKTASGTLRVRDATLQVDGHVEGDLKTSRPSISGFATLKGAATGKSVTYKFKGYLVTRDHPIIVGALALCGGEDLSGDAQPAGTTGMFYAVKEPPASTQDDRKR
jgi:hypothetical protein